MPDSADLTPVQQLLAALREEPDPARRKDALAALSHLATASDREAVEAIIGSLIEPDPEVRLAAAQTLRGWGKPCVAPLIAAFRSFADEQLEEKRTILQTLFLFGPLAAQAEPLLQTLVKDERLGPHAAAALRQLRPGLGDLLTSGSEALRRWILIAVCGVGGIALAVSFMAADFSIAARAGTACGGMCLVMGLWVGARTGKADADFDWLRPAAWALAMGVGGAAFGSILGGIFGAIYQPIADALGPK